jgi:hypothetical protein
MANGYRTIKEVVKSLRDPDGREISVVVCTDGMLGIAWDGKLVPSLEWSQMQMDQCVAFAERFAQTRPSHPDSDDTSGHSLSR